jgi:hypothetical protein
VPSSVVNLINNIVGAGLFSMPWCLKEATMLPGTVVVCSFHRCDSRRMHDRYLIRKCAIFVVRVNPISLRVSY